MKSGVEVTQCNHDTMVCRRSLWAGRRIAELEWALAATRAQADGLVSALEGCAEQYRDLAKDCPAVEWLVSPWPPDATTPYDELSRVINAYHVWCAE